MIGARQLPLILLLGSVVIGLTSPAMGQVPTVKMKSETAQRRFEFIANDVPSGGSRWPLEVVPARERLVITDVLLSGRGVACDLELYRSFPGGPGVCEGKALTSELCVPWNGGTVAHTFATGLVIGEGEHLCLLHGIGTGSDVPASFLVRGYYTKAKRKR